MTNWKKIFLLGFLTWLIPFIASFPFVDPSTGEFIVDIFLFKSIMIIVGALSGVYLAVRYFKGVSSDFLGHGIRIGLIWLLINWTLDVSLVLAGFFDMTLTAYVAEIGLRYLALPIYTIGMGYALQQKQ